MDWSLVDKNADLLAFARKVTALRKNHPVFRRRRFFEGEPIRSGEEVRDIAWLTPGGREMTHEDWDKSFHHRCVAAFLNGDAIAAPDARGERVSDDSFLLCFNAHDQYVEFITPQNDYAHEWTVELDTNDPVGDADLVVAAEAQLKVPARSLIVLRKTG
jgi:glycogen operon protein